MKKIDKKEFSQNPTDSKKRERRRKFSKVKDALHKGLGKKVFSGIGEPKGLYCDICQKKVNKVLSIVQDEKIKLVCLYCFQNKERQDE